MKKYFFTLMFGFLFFAGTSVFAQNGNGASIVEVPASFVENGDCGSFQVDAVIKIITQKNGFVNNWKGTATNLVTNEVFPFSAIATNHFSGSGTTNITVNQVIAGQLSLVAVLKIDSDGLEVIKTDLVCPGN